MAATSAMEYGFAPTSDDAFFFGNSRVTFLASASAGHGFTVIEHILPFGESPPLHIHDTEDEFFVVLEGRMRFQVQGETREVNAGETLRAPRGVPHAFRVVSPEGARCLTVTPGADFEAMVREASRPATHPGLPPHHEPTSEQIDALGRACARHNIRLIGAPIA